jgi:hypothetical protein
MAQQVVTELGIDAFARQEHNGMLTFGGRLETGQIPMAIPESG